MYVSNMHSWTATCSFHSGRLCARMLTFLETMTQTTLQVSDARWNEGDIRSGVQCGKSDPRWMEGDSGRWGAVRGESESGDKWGADDRGDPCVLDAFTYIDFWETIYPTLIS